MRKRQANARAFVDGSKLTGIDMDKYFVSLRWRLSGPLQSSPLISPI